MEMRWVRAAGSSGHADAADIEDPEIRDGKTGHLCALLPPLKRMYGHDRIFSAVIED